METIRDIVVQETIEATYSRKHIDGYIREAIRGNPLMLPKMQHAVALVHEYMGKNYYASKNARIKQLAGLDIEELVGDLMVGVAYFQKPELFTSVSASLASRLKFSDKTEAIKTVAELLAVICHTDAYDICKAGKYDSLMLVSRIPLEEKIVKFIENSQYLPPMVCEPLELTNNYSSGYLNHNDGLILGSGNMHDGDICLDVLNLVNSVQLKLDTKFLSLVEEEPTFELDSPEKVEGWSVFKRQSYHFYNMIAQHNGNFYLTHKVDKRGRIYAQGYHITTQGSAFKKASIELAHEEIVTGVPSV